MAYKRKSKAWVIDTKEGNAEVFFFSRKVTEKEANKIYNETYSE